MQTTAPRAPDPARHAPGPAAGGAPPGWLVWAALGIVYVVWGSTYLAIRVMVEDAPPLLAAGSRFAVAGALVLGFLAVRSGGRRVRLRAREWAAAAAVGTLLAAGGNGLVTVAERDVPSALAALVIASVPLWVVVLRATLGRERVALLTLAGVISGFGGIALLLLPGNRPDGATTAGLLLLVAAAVSWATGTFASGRVGLPRDTSASTGAQMLCGGAVLLVAGLLHGEAAEVRPAALTLDAVAAWAYLVVFGSLVAYTAYVWVLQHAPVSKVATYAYVNPVVAVLLGWAVLGETITATTLVATAVIVASVAAIVARESARPPATTPRVPEGHAGVARPAPAGARD